MVKLKLFILILTGILTIFINASAQPRELPKRIFGLTIESVDEIDKVIERIKEINPKNKPQMPVVRVIFGFNDDIFKQNKFNYEEADFKTEAEQYKSAIDKLRPYAFIVGLLVDSSYVHKLRHDRQRLHAVAERTKAYAHALNKSIDVWEIGNEINGEWVGWEDANRLVEPMITLEQLATARETAADEIMRSFTELKKIIPDAKTALTFYYNDDGVNSGWSKDEKSNLAGNVFAYGKNYSMQTWASEQRGRLPEVDYVWFSYYEDDNNGVLPNRNNLDVSGLVKVLVEMSNLFKTAQIGFGEMGPQCKYDQCKTNKDEEEEKRKCRECKKDQPLFVENYYIKLDQKIRAALDDSASGWDKNRNYCGGYFYWYFREDAVVNNNRNTVEKFKTAYTDWFGK